MNNLFGEQVVEETHIEDVECKRADVPKLYDWLTSINTTKEDLRVKDPSLRGYEPFIINKGLGQSQSTIGFAALMNRLAHIPKEYQYVFLRGGIPKNKSFAKWAKVEKIDKLKEVMAKLQCSEAKAKEAILVLGKKGVKQLLTIKGGKTK